MGSGRGPGEHRRDRFARSVASRCFVVPGPQNGRWEPLTGSDLLQVVQPLVGSLVAVARSILRCDDLAWDAVQEALVSLWLEEQVPPNPRAWLIRAVTHRSLHLARSRARRRKHEARACLERSETTDRDEPSRRLESEEVEATLNQAMREITEEHRDLLVLKSISQMDYAGLAEYLRIPPGTVRSRLNRSRRALGEILVRRLPEEYHALLPQVETGSSKR